MILASTRRVVGRLASRHSMSVMTHSSILSGRALEWVSGARRNATAVSNAWIQSPQRMAR